jgi:hypothetical protein
MEKADFINASARDLAMSCDGALQIQIANRAAPQSAGIAGANEIPEPPIPVSDSQRM